MTKSIGAAGLFTLWLLGPVLVSLQGCTNLDESPSSSITPGNFYRTEAEVLGGLAGVYAQLRSAFPGYCCSYYALSEVSTDEVIVPTRGQDWYDNGRWLEIHRQLWAANSPSGLQDINAAWVNGFTGIAHANVVLDALQRVSVSNQAVIEAELRTLRAFYYYMLMDLFGGVPIVTTTDIAARPRNTRAEVFQFIEAELEAARAALPDKWPDASNGRLTKGAADAILANMYLNAGVFARDAGVSATAYNTCQGVQVAGGQDACQAAIAAADRILNSGVYRLADSFPQNFRADNYKSPENILVVKFINQDGLGFRLVNASLHYNQFTPTPWNGFATLAETYNTFDAADQRRQVLLAGPQFNVEDGKPVKDRAGNPLVFTTTISDATQATEGEGARIYKWPRDPQHIGPDNGNDFAYFRLGEIYLIKAEALNEQGNTGGALTLLNALRARAFNPRQDLTAVDRDVILRERLFELIFEAKRRQDLIRYGKYTRQWSTTTLNGKVQREDYRILMPIPQTQLDANPKLVQNTGY